VGWRRDEDSLHRENLAYDPSRFNLTQRGFDEFTLPSSLPSVASKEIQSYSAILRWPRRLVSLPSSIDASVFANRSENFTPLGPRVNFFNERLAPPQGRNRESGLALSLWDERLTLRYTHFITGVENASFTVPFK